MKCVAALLVSLTLGSFVQSASAATASQTSLSALPTIASLGATVTLTATVTPGSPTGTVSFFDGSNFIGAAALVGRTASFQTTLLNAGRHSMKALYGGDLVYSPSLSAGTAVTINSTATGGFNTSSLATDGAANSVAVGYFNNDRFGDLVSANQDSNHISVFLGNGDGTFQPGVIYAVGNGPSSVAVSDIDLDGIADIVVANQTDNTIGILRGVGDGTFQAMTTVTGGNAPRSIKVGDFNQDGYPDVVVSNNNASSVSVFLNNHAGALVAGGDFNVTGASKGLVLGDFNADGKTDIAVANYTSSVNVVSVLIGNGDGTFQVAVSYPVGAGPTDVTTGDFNNDGVLDLAVANSTANTVSILLGNGSGGFGTVTSFSAPGGPFALVSTDVNGDGSQDLVIASNTTGAISVLAGNGSGTFQAAVNFTAGTGPRALVATNLNGDNRIDLAVATSADSVTVMLGAQTTVTTLSAGPNPALQGQSVTFTATVSPATAVGNVNFNDGSTVLATVPLVNGTASYTTSSLALGSHSITAVYTGSTTLAQSTSSTIVEYIVLSSSATLSVSPTTVVYGGTVVFTATVTPSAATGKVTFYDGTVVLGTGIVTAGQAMFHASQLNGGTHTLLAHYDGDANYISATTNTVMVTVTVNSGGGFQAPANYASGSGPISAVVGDFNGDGFSDIATSNYVNNSVSILLGNGDGSFRAPANYGVGASPISIGKGDFNGDGATDLVVVNYSSGTLSVLLGHGDGTFVVAGTYTAGTLPQGLSVGDFNGDGYADVAVTDSGTSQVGILLGVGDGSFRPSTAIAVAGGVKGIVTADFNGDLKADLAVAAGDGAYVLIGNGDGTFAAPVMYPVGSGPTAIAATDLGNGHVDLLVVNSLSNTVSVLIGNGDGTFTAAASYPTGTFPQALSLGDFNGDGKMDVVVANQSSGDVSVLYSNGDGTLQTAVSYSVGASSGPTSVVVAPFHGTGQADLAVPGYQSSTVAVLLALQGSHVTLTADPNPDPTGAPVTLTATVTPSNATGGVTFYSGNTSVGSSTVTNGTATLTVTLPAGSQALTAVYSGDTVFGSSVSAVVTENVAQTATIISVAANPNPATFGKPVTFTATVNETAANGLVTFYSGALVIGQAALVNGTATLQVAAMPAGSQSVIAQFDGSAQYGISRSNPLAFTVIAQAGYSLTTAQAYTVGTSPVSVAAADFNLDGKMDVVAATGNGASVLLGNGNGTFQAASSLLAGTGPTQVVTADFNSDGRPDIAVSDAGGNNLSVLLGNGDGTFQTAVAYGAGAGPNSLATADFNGDGIPDLAVANRGGGTANVLLGRGDGTFNAGSSITVGTTNVFIAAGDFNNDGRPDLAIADSSANAVWILLGNGDGTFQTPVSNAVGASPISIAVADFNGDGKWDLAVANQGSGNLSVLLGTGTGTFAPAVTYNSGAGTQFVAAGDFTGDGVQDLIVASQAGTVGVMIGLGDGTFRAPVTFGTGMNPVSIALANFNGDGKTQVAVANQASNSVSFLLDAPAALTVVQGNPQTAAAGSTFATPLAVQANGYGSATGGVSVVFTAPSTGASGIFSNSGTTATVVTGADGVATAPSFTANGTAGTYAVTATAGGSAVTFTLTNTASGCVYTVNSAPVNDDATGGTATFNVTATGTGCTWGAVSSASWVTLSTTGTTGSGSVVATVAANSTGAQRTATLLIAGVSIPVTEAGTTQVFADVPPSAYYFDAVNTLYSKGITAGCSTQPFDYCPQETVTRAQMAIFIVRAVYGSDNFTYSPTPYFTDVPTTAFGFQWIQKLYELGITTGCGTNLYCPNDSVARDQMAVFLVRMRLGATAPFDYPTTPYFTDVPPTEFAFKWIQRIAQDQITSGCSPTTYCPSSSITRGDMAVLLVRSAYNLLLPANFPAITQISPTTIARGQTVTMTVTGVNTTFTQGVTQMTNLTGVTFGTPTVTSPTSLTVQVTVDANAAVQPYSVSAVTGQELAVLPNRLLLQ